MKSGRSSAAAAAKLVRNNQCVLLDSGATTTAIARELRKFSNLTIITNAINIATELGHPEFEIVMTGGTLRKNSFSLVEPMAEDMLVQIRADILFLGVDGFDPKIGITTPNVLKSRVNRTMVKASRKVVAVCDSTKFNRSSMALIVSPTAIDTVITDDQVQHATVDTLRVAGIEGIVV
ncbi:MAG: hypothetical protein ABI177_13105 [Edaphobacter sp.]